MPAAHGLGSLSPPQCRGSDSDTLRAGRDARRVAGQRLRHGRREGASRLAPAETLAGGLRGAGGRQAERSFLSLFLLFFFSPASKSRKSVSLALGRGVEGRQAAAALT